MRVLSIGADKAVLDPASRVRERQAAYSQLFDELSIVLCAVGGPPSRITASQRLTLESTGSWTRWSAPFGAVIAGLRTLRKGGVWVVTAQDPCETGLAAFIISLITGAPLHLQVHTDILAPEVRARSVWDRLRYLLAVIILPRAQAVRVVSKRIADSFVQRWPDLAGRISILPIFVDPSRFQTGEPEEIKRRFPGFSRYLLCVSRLESEKNLELAIDVCAELMDRGDNPCLLIVGEGRLLAALRSRCASRGVSERVFFEGQKDNVWPYYAGADLLLVTSAFEGFGLVLLEGALAEMLIVSTDVGIAREIGATIASRRPTDFADAIVALKGPPLYKLPDYVVTDWDEYLRRYAAGIEQALEFQQTPPAGSTSLYQRSGKRIFDLIISTILLVLLSPLLAAIGALVLCSMGRPVLFRQTRVGRGSEYFTFFKFRTMRTQSSGETASDHERLTAIGRWLRRTSLDELPQLLNVLRGEMSLVGPRPLLVEYLPRYSAFQARRHETLPGITGWAQTNGRNRIDWPERFELDVWYVDHVCFMLDLRILWRTALRVVARRDIDQTATKTMSPFLGGNQEKP